MPQVLLTVVAILVFSIFALQQHESNKRLEQVAIGSEVELAATEVAREQLIAITSLAYDEADVGSTALRTDETGLSAIGPDSGESSSSQYDDLDDFHGHEQNFSVDWHGSALDFTARSEVRYVDPATPSNTSTNPTLAKEVVVIVSEVNADPAGREQVTVRLHQVLTPAWSLIHS